MTPNVPRADQQKWWWLALGALFLLLLYYLSPVLTPFALAGILAYICLPLVDRLSHLSPLPAAQGEAQFLTRFHELRQ